MLHEDTGRIRLMKESKKVNQKFQKMLPANTIVALVRSEGSDGYGWYDPNKLLSIRKAKV